MRHLSDEQLKKLRLGGHDPVKVYNAFKAAVEHKGAPTVVIAKTIKGYGLGEAGEGKNITHQQKKLNEDELKAFRARFSIEISDEQLHTSPFLRPADDSPEIQYVQSRRKALGGYVPSRTPTAARITKDLEPIFKEFYSGTDDRKVSTTMVFVKMLAKMLRDDEIGKLVVPIVPDEARTFGMEALFRQVGIYSHVGQLYEPVDSDTLLYYKEARDGQIFEEGITEAGSMSTLIAAGTAYATHGLNMIPFFIYYSMFGFQRIGDLIWAAGDSRCRGFLLGGTAGRTTLAGEGLQHQDGNSHVLSLPVPNCVSYVGDAVRHRQRQHVAVAVLVLQPFTGQRRPARGAAEQEPAAARVASSPDEIADPLEAEHRVIDEERDHVQPVRGVRRACGNQRRHRPGFRDALFEDLPVARFLVIEQRVAVDRLVQLADVRVDPDLAEQRLHAERARLIRDDWHDELANLVVAQHLRQHLHEHHRRRDLAVVGARVELLEDRLEVFRDASGGRRPGRHVATERLAARLHVLDFRAVVRRTQERGGVELLVRDFD